MAVVVAAMPPRSSAMVASCSKLAQPVPSSAVIRNPSGLIVEPGDCSTWHVDEQPSPLVGLPSSHCSPASRAPLPQIGVASTCTENCSVALPGGGGSMPKRSTSMRYVVPGTVVNVTRDCSELESSLQTGTPPDTSGERLPQEPV